MRFKTLFYILVGFIIVCVAWKCNDVLYFYNLARGQMKILIGSVPIEEVLKDDELADSNKTKLKLVAGIKHFAEDELGLASTANYRSFYDQHNKPLLWVVTASERYALKPYKWIYPVVGALDYRGYFNYSDAKIEASGLEAIGYDIRVDAVSAWSTLGWFSDPVLSGMLNKKEGEIARLIIHELTHSTFYFISDADESENIATFIGDNGAEVYLNKKYGKTSPQVQEFKNNLIDVQKYAQHLIHGASILDSLYLTMTPGITVHYKDSLKESAINAVISSLDTIDFHNPERFAFLHERGFHANNAFFIGFLMYRKEQEMRDKELKDQFGGDLKCYIQYLKTKTKKKIL